MNASLAQAHGRVPIAVLHLAGQISLDTASELKQMAQNAFDGGARYLLIDLTAVESITSAGLSALHSIYASFTDRSSREIGATRANPPADHPFKSLHVKLLNPAAQVRRVLVMTGFDIFLEIHDDLQAAIASF
ncbi:MAG TPA: STAS domain-containing protein [Anaerolineae bacterium]|nr:STAS domain-containing protein [Anaerolineae bacterium]